MRYKIVKKNYLKATGEYMEVLNAAGDFVIASNSPVSFGSKIGAVRYLEDKEALANDPNVFIEGTRGGLYNVRGVGLWRMNRSARSK